jgi:hypothetical protein
VAVSANPPSITDVTADPSSDGGPVTLSWNQSDPDGDALSSIVLYSYDGGTDWQPITSGVTGTTYTVDSSDLPGSGGSAAAIFCVIVTDGVLTADSSSSSLLRPWEGS